MRDEYGSMSVSTQSQIVAEEIENRFGMKPLNRNEYEIRIIEKLHSQVLVKLEQSMKAKGFSEHF